MALALRPLRRDTQPGACCCLALGEPKMCVLWLLRTPPLAAAELRQGPPSWQSQESLFPGLSERQHTDLAYNRAPRGRHPGGCCEHLLPVPHGHPGTKPHGQLRPWPLPTPQFRELALSSSSPWAATPQSHVGGPWAGPAGLAVAAWFTPGASAGPYRHARAPSTGHQLSEARGPLPPAARRLARAPGEGALPRGPCLQGPGAARGAVPE